MRILIFNTLYAPHQVGGAEKSVQILAEELVKNGHEVHLTCLGPEQKEDTLNGVKVHYFKTPNLFWIGSKETHSKIKKLAWHLLDRWNPISFFKFKSFIKKISPEVVHTNNLGGFSTSIWSAAKSLNIKTVHTLRDYYLSCPKTTRFNNNQICETPCSNCQFFSKPKLKASHQVDHLIGISKFILNKHIDEGYFRGAKSKTVIYNTINTSLNNPSHKKETLKNTFGFMGQIVQSKGIELLIETFNNCPNAKLLIFGKCKSEEYLSHLKGISNDNIEFCDFAKPEEIFSQIQYLCVPSLWEEPFGRVIIEANSYEIPVLASPRGGIPELIEEGKNGILVEDDQWEIQIQALCLSPILYTPHPCQSTSYKEYYQDLFDS